MDNSRPGTQRHGSLCRDASAGAGTRVTYAFRPKTIIKRLQQERIRQEVSGRDERSKPRPAPLSKYRRKTANARERHRMRQINIAFESLRRILPDGMALQPATSAMTKITTLRLAVSYIRALSDTLEDNHMADSLERSFQHSVKHSFQLPKTLSSEGSVIFQYQTQMASFTQQAITEAPYGLAYCPTPSTTQPSTFPHKTKGSLSSGTTTTRALHDLLSDDTRLLPDNLQFLGDIPALTDFFGALP
ncbi:neurogenic differentiation factor 1-like [Procambarus clarkii]|uniref:neurogenic differentiation factor 1-like n=1 Tax=Procambarus clarkii TaxID=6728 RepID=UPI001E674EDD|nr:neurogenin-3-like [Procambarus clarkii]